MLVIGKCGITRTLVVRTLLGVSWQFYSIIVTEQRPHRTTIRQYYYSCKHLTAESGFKHTMIHLSFFVCSLCGSMVPPMVIRVSFLGTFGSTESTGYREKDSPERS